MQSDTRTPTRAATVTHAATVSATAPQTITGMATVWVNWRQVYLPLFPR